MDDRAVTTEEFLKLIEPRFESIRAARTWFEQESLSGFSGATAQQLLNAGRATDLMDYLAAVDAGVYA